MSRATYVKLPAIHATGYVPLDPDDVVYETDSHLVVDGVSAARLRDMSARLLLSEEEGDKMPPAAASAAAIEEWDDGVAVPWTLVVSEMVTSPADEN